MIGWVNFVKAEKIEKLSDNIISEDIDNFTLHLEKLKGVSINKEEHKINILRSGAKSRIIGASVFTGYVASGLAVVAIIVSILGVVVTFSGNIVNESSLNLILILLTVFVVFSAAVGIYHLVSISTKSKNNKHYEQIIEICNMEITEIKTKSDKNPSPS